MKHFGRFFEYPFRIVYNAYKLKQSEDEEYE